MFNSDQQKEIKQRIDKARNKPLVVVVLGQTGVGKSSLINALFGTRLKTNDVQPETKFPEKHVERNANDSELWFWDMPGIGESLSADAKYLDSYREKILEADVALWLCHSDSRSVTFDTEAIQKILSGMPDGEQSALLSKLTFILSKADLITPEPWILFKDRDKVIFETHETTEKVLEAKASYFRDALVSSYGEKFISRTFHNGNFNINSGKVSFDKYFVYYSGIMTDAALNRLKREYPEHSKVFTRLKQNSEVVYCSSRYKYNLAKLMRVIVDKISGEASMRFPNFTSKEKMNTLPWKKAKTFGNLVVFDIPQDDITHDLKKVI